MLRWISRYSPLILIWVTFGISGTIFVRDFVKYRGVESWPSTGAEIISTGGTIVSHPVQTRYGMGSTTSDSRFVEFEYSVAGRSYRSHMASPDGGGLPINPLNQPWRAFYRPSSPDVAVLMPLPYRGYGYLITAIFSGMIALGSLWFGLQGSSQSRSSTDTSGHRDR